jgi:hypothetical protein
MKRFSILVISFFSIISISAQQINDVNAEVRQASGFRAISVSNAFDVYLTQSNQEAVAVSASEAKYKERIKVEVKDGTLIIKYENEGKMWSKGDKKLKVYISFKEIEKLNISGACDVFVNGIIKARDLVIHQSGASDLKGKLEISGTLDVDLSGASDMQVSGSAANVRIDASGACDFKGYDFVTETCNAKASGASDIKITVNKELSAQATGASDVHFKGTGVIKDLKSSGSSSVSKG